MTIILDLEDTLVDTTGFKRVFFRCLEDVGVPAAVVAESYARLRERHEFTLRGLYDHLPAAMRPPLSIYSQTIERALGQYQFRMYPDVIWFLAQLRGYRRVLYTYGDRRLQEIKVESLRLRRFFEVVSITEDRTKLHDFPLLLRDAEETVLVDNDGAFIAEAVRRFPTVRGLRIERRQLGVEGAYPDLRAIHHALLRIQVSAQYADGR